MFVCGECALRKHADAHKLLLLAFFRSHFHAIWLVFLRYLYQIVVNIIHKLCREGLPSKLQPQGKHHHVAKQSSGGRKKSKLLANFDQGHRLQNHAPEL